MNINSLLELTIVFYKNIFYNFQYCKSQLYNKHTE